MKKLLSFLMLLLVICCSMGAVSQTATFDYTRPADIVSPSPVAAALVREVSVPVNYYTGTPNIHIPIHTVKAGKLSMPISLNYNATGIKVEQDAGLTGLNWDLQTGGAISRSVIGKPDEDATRGYRISAQTLHYPLPGHEDSIGYWINSLTACNMRDLSKGRYELTPDSYFMNFNGNSARLFFDWQQKPYFSPYKAWKISGTEISGYSVTTDDGTMYKFDSVETSRDDYSSSNGDAASFTTAVSSWLLTSVISADKTDTIRLNYAPITYYPVTHNSPVTKAFLYKGQTTIPNTSVPSDSYTNTTDIIHTVNGYLLSNIVSKDEQVNFYYNTGRSDVPTFSDGLPYKLDSIKTYALTPTASNVLTTYLFNYDYYNSGAAFISQRLRLLSVATRGANNEAGELYQFGYEGSALPPRDATSQDAWGFYNGTANTQGLIPGFYNNWGQWVPGANRDADSLAATTGILTSVTYPTGGTTSFEFETNRYNTHAAGARDSIASPLSMQVQTAARGSAGTDLITSSAFVVSYDQPVTITYNIQENVSYNNDGAYVRIDTTTSPGPSNYLYLNNTIGSGTAQMQLPRGTYYLTAFRVHLANNDQYASIKLDYAKHIMAPFVGIPAGGVRIRRLIESDGLTQHIKHFMYLQDTITSSGKLLSTPLFQGDQYAPAYCTCSGGGKVGDYKYLTFHSTSTVEMGRTQGNFLCYSRVTVLDGDNGENGKEDFTYSLVTDVGDGSYPYIPLGSRDNVRGQLLSQLTYAASGKLLQRLDNTFNLNYSNGNPRYRFIEGVKVGAQRVGGGDDVSGCPILHGGTGSDFIVAPYNIYQLWPTLAQTRKAVYSSATTDSVVTLEKFNYDTVNLQPWRKVAWNSKGDSLVDSLKYSKDYPGTPVYDTMIARNVISALVQDDHYYNTAHESKGITNYQLVNTGSFLSPLPLNRQLGYLSSTPETRLEFANYDSRSNLLTQRKINDASHSYIWDYWGHQPVAEVVNATSSDVAATSFEFDGGGNFSIGSAVRDSLNAITGKRSYNLSNGSVTKSGLNSSKTYIVSYWSKTNSATVNGGTAASIYSKNGWNYYEHSFSGATSATITGSVLIDELRLFPSDALMTTYTYQPLTGISTLCSANNLIQYYEYDGLQRLVNIRDMDRNVVKHYDYRYQVAAMPYLNAAQTHTYTRSNCATGYTPGTYTYAIPYAKYGSTIDQGHADAQATAEMNASGQHYADSLGTCTITPESITSTNSTTQTVAAAFTNTSTSAVYNFTLNTGTSGYSQGTIPYGNYNVTMTPASPLATYFITYSLNTTQQTNYAAVTFSNFAVNAPITVKAVSGCGSSNCSGVSHKCINGTCETGTLQVVSQTYSGGKCTTTYGYVFSDGSYNFDHSTVKTGPCVQ